MFDSTFSIPFKPGFLFIWLMQSNCYTFGASKGKKLRFKTKLLTALVALLTTSLSLWGWVGCLSATLTWLAEKRHEVSSVCFTESWSITQRSHRPAEVHDLHIESHFDGPRLPSWFLPSLLLDQWQWTRGLWCLDMPRQHVWFYVQMLHFTFQSCWWANGTKMSQGIAHGLTWILILPIFFGAFFAAFMIMFTVQDAWEVLSY